MAAWFTPLMAIAFLRALGYHKINGQGFALC